MIVCGDQTYADSYLNGAGDRGVSIEVEFVVGGRSDRAVRVSAVHKVDGRIEQTIAGEDAVGRLVALVGSLTSAP